MEALSVKAGHMPKYHPQALGFTSKLSKMAAFLLFFMIKLFQLSLLTEGNICSNFELENEDRRSKAKKVNQRVLKWKPFLTRVSIKSE